MRFGDDQIVDVELMVVLGVGDGALQRLLHRARDPLARKLQVGERHRDLLPADECGNKIELARAGAHHVEHRLRLIVLERPLTFGLAHYALFALRSAAWPKNVRVGANSPNLWPIMSSETRTGMCL